MNVPKFEYFRGNMKDYENLMGTTKKGTPRMLIITVVFEQKWMMMLEDKKEALQECL